MNMNKENIEKLENSLHNLISNEHVIYFLTYLIYPTLPSKLMANNF